MAWQPPSAMAGGGGFAGDGAANGSHPQGTEYTLQGVMRFLQTEWHRHERDRNAWEIERAEMKSRIGRLEGDVRTSKRLHESVGKHVKLLEAALKKEREKVKKLSNGEKIEDFRDSKEIARESLNALKSQRPRINTDLIDAELDPDGLLQSDLRQEPERDKSRLYLSKCSQEVSYHVIPASHPPPELIEHDLPNNNFYENQQISQSVEFIEQQLQKQRNASSNMSREVDIQNHQPVVTQYAAENSGLFRTNSHIPHHPVSREASEMRTLDFQQPAIPTPDSRKPTFDQGVYNEREDLARYRVQASSKENSRQQPQRRPSDESSQDIDGWNFDDLPSQEQSTELIPRRRPDTDAFPNANFVRSRSPARGGGSHSHRQKGLGSKRRSDGSVDNRDNALVGQKQDAIFKVRFALRGHLDVVRSVIFTGGGSPSEPEICTCSDDGTIKRWIIPATYGGFGSHGPNSGNDLDITSYFTHRGHVGAVTALAACSPSQNFSNSGRALGDGWVFSGGQDASVKVWERGRVDPKATLDGHTDAVWGLCVLPGTTGSIFGDACGHYGGPDRVLLISGAADGKILVWSVSAPPQASSPQAGSRTRGGSRRANSISSGSNFPSSPQPSVATSTPFDHTLVHHIVRPECPSPTCISPLSPTGNNFVVSYGDASIIVYDTKVGEEIVGMASLETYDGTPSTGVNSVVATTVGFDGAANLEPAQRTMAEEEVHGATGSSGVEGVIISGYEDRYIRFFDANSGQCTYTMLAHPAAIASLSLSPDGHELVSAGHDASLRFWDLEKRSCTQEITSHRMMRGEGVCSAVWSRDGRWVISGGGDGVVKVFSR